MTIKTVTFHQRSTGKTGQVLASPQVEKKLAKVEALYRKYHGKKMGRYNFYDLALQVARDAKQEVGGYIQYTAEAAAGVFLDHMHKHLSEAVKRNDTSEPIIFEIGSVEVNLDDLKRRGRGKGKRNKVTVHPVSGKRILTPRKVA